MFALALLAAALSSPCASFGLPAGSIWFTPVPPVAGTPVTVCVNPLPGPEPRNFEWDLGSDGTVDWTTTVPELTIPSTPSGTLVLTLRYPFTGGTSTTPLRVPVADHAPVGSTPTPPAASAPLPPAGPGAAVVRREGTVLVARAGAGDTANAISAFNGPILGFPADAHDPGFTIQTNCRFMSEYVNDAHWLDCRDPVVTSAEVYLGGGDDEGSATNDGPFRDGRPLPLTVYGEGGNDHLSAASGGHRERVRIDGGPGEDHLISENTHGGTDGKPDLSGGPGDDWFAVHSHHGLIVTIDGGPGDDLVLAETTDASGREIVDGGPGDDETKVRGGGADRVSCGTGADLVSADRRDQVAHDCEIVARSIFNDEVVRMWKQARAALARGRSSFRAASPTPAFAGRLTFTLSVGGRTIATARQSFPDDPYAGEKTFRLAPLPHGRTAVLRTAWSSRSRSWAAKAPVRVG